MHRSLAMVALVAALSGCGPGHKDVPACPIISGTFSAHSTLSDTSGTCSAAKPISVDPIAFTKGRYESPVGDLASCTTRQAGCAVSVTCKSPLLSTANFTFVGTLSPDGTTLTGTATFTGSYQGCSRVVYQVDATQQ